MFNASFQTIVLRYYLLMLVIIVPFFIGAPVLALLGLPVFLLSLTATKIDNPLKNKERKFPNEVAKKETARASETLAY